MSLSPPQPPCSEVVLSAFVRQLMLHEVVHLRGCSAFERPSLRCPEHVLEPMTLHEVVHLRAKRRSDEAPH